MEYSKELVENCALQKALDVKNRVDNDSSIVSADTVVVQADEIVDCLNPNEIIIPGVFIDYIVENKEEN